MADLSTQRRSPQDMEGQIGNSYQVVLQGFNHDFPKRPNVGRSLLLVHAARLGLRRVESWGIET